MKKVTKSSRNHSARKTTVSKLKGVARVFQRGGGGITLGHTEGIHQIVT